MLMLGVERETTRGLFTAAFETTLALSDAETTQPLDVLRCVVAPPIRGALGSRESPEPLAKSEPRRSYAK